MPVRLMVTKGASAGKTFEIKVPQFVIGRSSSCQLRPQSDAISRQHCVVLLTKDGGAAIRDLGSRNGTIVNGKTTKGTQVLQTGDEVRVGPLHLEVTILDATG
ncbi:MAG: FHA domain-containing protein, partial [Planctomycetota bacterium]